MKRPLHSVPARPDRPVDPPRAIEHVAATLPDLDEPARIALALVELAGRSRSDVAAERGVAEAELGVQLARARKALRRTVAPLPGTGWCERSERLISDELDGDLAPREIKLLETHLSRCERCVDHERKLAAARNSLVETVPVEAPPLTVVEPAPTPEPEPEPNPDADPKSEQAESIADPPPLPVEPERALGAAIFWGSLIAISVLLTVASVVLVVLGATGALQHTF
jgi:hypothetical protein